MITEIYVVKTPQGPKPTFTHVGLAKLANDKLIDVKELTIIETETMFYGYGMGTLIINGKPFNRWGGAEVTKKFNKDGKATLDQHSIAKLISRIQRNIFKMFFYGDKNAKEILENYDMSKAPNNQKQQTQPPATPPENQQKKQETQSSETATKEKHRDTARNHLESEKVQAVLTEAGKTSQDVQKFAVDLWGANRNWDIPQWAIYTNAIIKLAKKEGELAGVLITETSEPESEEQNMKF